MAESLIGIRIILVEDHDDCREIFATMLRFHGAVVTAVANAREAIGIVAHADIVVTDFSMSGGDDGAWLLERVNEQPRPIPVIVDRAVNVFLIVAAAPGPVPTRIRARLSDGAVTYLRRGDAARSSDPP